MISCRRDRAAEGAEEEERMTCQRENQVEQEQLYSSIKTFFTLRCIVCDVTETCGGRAGEPADADVWLLR
jgi:hypothetical protein